MALPRRQAKKLKRESRWRSQAHLSFIRSFHCSIPECAGMPIEAAHVRLGSGAGIGQKPDDFRAVPLCKECHSSQHTMGEASFWRRYMIVSGQTVEDLLTELCQVSPKAADIRREKREREGG